MIFESVSLAFLHFCFVLTKTKVWCPVQSVAPLIRSKFSSIPIPGNDISMNGDALISAGKEEQTALRDELKTVMDELTYGKLMEGDAETVENSNKVMGKVPMLIYSG